MSKAFTKEDGEGAPDDPAPGPSRPPLPKGVPNYVTPAGKAALVKEHQALLAEVAALALREPGPERARAAARASLERAALEERLASAQVVDPAGQPRDEVRFGALVTVRDAAAPAQEARLRRLQLVGVDEAEAAAGKIAFLSPLARALLGRTVGEVATVRTPRGEEAWEIVSLSYEVS